MKPIIETWYPTSILMHKLENQRELLSSYIHKSYDIRNSSPIKTDWNCNTYNSLNAYDMFKDSMFNSLFDEITYWVNTFAETHYNVENPSAKCSESWINISPPMAYQEYHIHPNSHFSAVFYVKTPPESGNIIFRSHEANFDMFELPRVNDINHYNGKTFWHEPEECKLLIFRSNLSHMVKYNKSNEDRISIATNFIL